MCTFGYYKITPQHVTHILIYIVTTLQTIGCFFILKKFNSRAFRIYFDRNDLIYLMYLIYYV